MFKNIATLKFTLEGQSRSSEMAPFDRACTSSYSSSVVTVATSCIVSEIK